MQTSTTVPAPAPNKPADILNLEFLLSQKLATLPPLASTNIMMSLQANSAEAVKDMNSVDPVSVYAGTRIYRELLRDMLRNYWLYV